MTTSSVFTVVMKLLADDYHCLAPDLRGFGHSSYLDRITSVQDIVDDLVEMIEKKELSRFSVLACGGMGAVAMMLADQLGKVVERVVIISGY